MRQDEIHLNSLILPPHVKRCQIIAVEVASLAKAAVLLAVEVIPLAAGRTVVWAAGDIDAAARLPGRYRALKEEVDTLAGTADTADTAEMVVGIVEVVVDLP